MSRGRRPLARALPSAPARSVAVPPAAGRLATSVRRTLARRRWLRRCLVLAAAIAVAGITLDRLDQVDAARDRWGDTTDVLVASADLEPGDALRAEIRAFPRALVPWAAVTPDHADADLIARQRVTAGEVVVEADITAPGPLGLVPDGWMIVAVTEAPPSGASTGERVRLASEGIVIVDEGLVVGHEGEATLIAAPAHEAPLVPAAADAGTLAVMRSP